MFTYAILPKRVQPLHCLVIAAARLAAERDYTAILRLKSRDWGRL